MANQEKLWQAAQKIYENLWCPSDCYRLKSVPKSVRVIYCDGSLVDLCIARQIAKALGEEVTIIVKEDINNLAFAMDYFGDYGFYEEDLYIVNRAVWDMIRCKTSAKVVVREEFLEDKTWIIRSRWTDAVAYKELKNYDYIVVYDDDITLLVQAAKLWWELMKQYGTKGPSGKTRKILALGGQGKSSNFVFKQNESKVQESTLRRLFIPRENIVTMAHVKSKEQKVSFWDLQQMFAEVMEYCNDNAVVVVSQRASSLWKKTMDKQHPNVNADMYVEPVSLQKVSSDIKDLKYNGKEQVLYYVANLLPQWRKYENKYMTAVEGIKADVEAAAKILENEYLAKQGGLRAIPQYIGFDKLCMILLLKHKKSVKEYNFIIRTQQVIFWNTYNLEIKDYAMQNYEAYLKNGDIEA